MCLGDTRLHDTLRLFLHRYSTIRTYKLSALQKFLFEKLCLLITVSTANYSLDRGTWPVGLSERFGCEFVLYVPVADWTRFVTLYFLEIVIFPEIFESLCIRDFVF